MKNLIFILSLCGIVFTCSQSLDTRTPLANKSNSKLLGDWKLSIDSIDAQLPHGLYISFDEEFCYARNLGTEKGQYNFRNDTLSLVYKSSRKSMFLDTLRFQVTQLDSLSMSFFNLNHSKERRKRKVNSLRYNLKYNSEFHFEKIIKKHDEQFVRLGFLTTPCFGFCEIMYLEIDQHGNFLFNGKDFTSKDGFYEGTLNTDQFSDILNKIKSIDLDSLEEFYQPEIYATDNPSRKIIIQTESKKIVTGSYGFVEPVELRLLMDKLMYLYKTLDLDANDNVINKFAFEEELSNSPIKLKF